MPSKAGQIEELYTAHDELLDDPIRKGDRNLADATSFRRLFAWQYCEYYGLLRRCMEIAGEDYPEFKAARKALRDAEFTAKGREGDLRLATAKAEIAIQLIHKWLDRIRANPQPKPKSHRTGLRAHTRIQRWQ